MKLCIVLYFSWLFYDAQAWVPSSRLRRDSFPISYTLKLIPDSKSETFDGEVTILIKTIESIENITLNSKSLDITEITLDQAIGETKFHLDAERQFLHVSYSDRRYVDPGEHILNIKFKGILASYTGFYAVNFDDENNESRTVLATKFSPTHAREAFPCYDEPHFKSIFNIRLIKPNDTWTALSNMEEIGQVKTSNGTLVDFRSTVPMSTYLLAWCLVDFKYDEIKYHGPHRSIPLRFFTSKAKTSDSRAVLETTKKSLEFFENYTGIPYPLSKLDSIEIARYRSGGMEHWGMIVYRADAVTFNPNYYLYKLHHWVDATMLIAHEISHMWFGNLVSHEWYNDLWLTEGFARFMQYKAAYSISGENFMKMLFQKDKFNNLIDRHCNDNKYSIETAGYSRKLSELWKKFGPLTYDQGAAILQMLEDVIGAEKFQDAVRKHLKSHMYSFATTADFINIIQEEVPTINIREFMTTYLFQKNLPLIKVTEDENQYILTQTPYCENGETSIFRNRWTVPINYITNGNETHGRVWFDRDMSNVTIAKPMNNSWIIVNHGHTGLYRTLYSREIYRSLREHFKELYIGDRSLLIDETFMLASSHKLSCDIPLQFLGELKHIEEIDYLSFKYVTLSLIEFTRRNDFDNEVADILRSYYIQTFEGLYNNISWTVTDNESKEQRLLRQILLDAFCREDKVYSGCYRDVELITKQNLTVHEDVEYIYNEIYKNMIENKTKMEDGVKQNTTLNNEVTSSIPKSEYVQNCTDWIKKLLREDPESNTISNIN